METSLLTLGSFSFQGLETPERIYLKKKQRLATHHLGSGLFTTNVLGEDFEIVSFSGTFSGAGAGGRIRLIDSLRIHGAPLVLVWGAKTLLVLIEEFDLNYLSEQWIPYKLSCRVVSSTGVTPASPLDIISSSALEQMSSITYLLGNTAITPTRDQTDALLTLAASNYDTPPLEAIHQAQTLMGEIDTRIAGLNVPTESDASSMGTIASQEGLRMTNVVSNLGLQATLLLARNRVANVIVCAEAIIQL